uniref:ATP synthase mitochondrial F1 complex assembly factor 1 n=1 Tax=Noccaea caerulescens TaxID=107243 RepID=A0A1J3J315_NOCCA
MKMRRILRSISSLATEKLSSSSDYYSRCQSRQIFSSSSQRNAGGKLSEALPGNRIKWASLGSVRNSQFASGFTPLKPKPLDSIMDLHRAQSKSPEELTSAWDDYHLGRGHIGITMNAMLYRLLEQRASECRYFVIPLWRGHGYITMFAQVEAPHMIFTGLEDYKARGTQAAPYLTTTFYTELSETKDLVFIRGDVVFTSKLTDEEAKWLMEAAQSFYLNDSRYKLLERFNKHTQDFEFKDVLQALDMPIL